MAIILTVYPMYGCYGIPFRIAMDTFGFPPLRVRVDEAKGCWH